MDREIIRTGNTGGRQGSSPAVMIKDILGIILRNWFWFALCLLVALVAAFFYVKSKQPVYARSASIMVRSNVSDTDRTLKELGITQTPTNLANEILMMNTAIVAEEVVRRLNLDVEYTQDGPF